jgi:prolipoprotein diacylglyceryltransferase
MHSLVLGFPVYFAAWLVAAVVCISIGVGMAERRGYPALRSAGVLVCCALVVLIGSKLLYVAETIFFPFDDHVPPAVRSSLHGFRIPGGVLPLALLAPAICSPFRLPWRPFGDLEIPLMAAALVFIRVGCFLNGCCFGKLSSLPWALSFPPESWVFRYQVSQGWLPPKAAASLPVHPLQLYFVAAAGITLVMLLAVPRRLLRPGQRQLLFYTLFFSTTALLEPFRANTLRLNTWLVSAAALACAVLLSGRLLLAKPAPEPSPVR